MRALLGTLTLASLVTVLGGCYTTEPTTRPPTPPMEFRPPPDDLAYSRPMEYPADTMDQDPTIKKTKGAGLPGLTQRPGQNLRTGAPGF